MTLRSIRLFFSTGVPERARCFGRAREEKFNCRYSNTKASHVATLHRIGALERWCPIIAFRIEFRPHLADEENQKIALQRKNKIKTKIINAPISLKSNWAVQNIKSLQFQSNSNSGGVTFREESGIEFPLRVGYQWWLQQDHDEGWARVLPAMPLCDVLWCRILW